jgi:hypothetical protein
MRVLFSNLFSIMLLNFICGIAWAASEKIAVDEIYKMDAQVLKLAAVTSLSSLPSGDPITTLVRVELSEQIFDETGKLQKGLVQISVLSHWNDNDNLFDSWAQLHCIEVDIQAAILRALEKANIADFNRLGISILPPILNNIGSTPIVCETFLRVDAD